MKRGGGYTVNLGYSENGVVSLSPIVTVSDDFQYKKGLFGTKKTVTVTDVDCSWIPSPSPHLPFVGQGNEPPSTTRTPLLCSEMRLLSDI